MSKTQGQRSQLRPLEADEDDMFWELDKEVCMLALSPARFVAKNSVFWDRVVSLTPPHPISQVLDSKKHVLQD